tara:strand:+ start:134 stop:277 length:144 start_codon:yes stop_codon:yes gene_type:complete
MYKQKIILPLPTDQIKKPKKPTQKDIFVISKKMIKDVKKNKKKNKKK